MFIQSQKNLSQYFFDIVKYYAFIIRGMYRKAAIDLGIYQYSSFLKHNFESPNASIFFGDSCDMYIYAEKNIEAGQLIQPCFYFAEVWQLISQQQLMQ